MALRLITERAAALTLAAALGFGAAAQAQADPVESPEEVPEAMIAPGFDWQKTTKLPGLAKLVKQGCAIALENALFTESEHRVVASGDLFGMCQDVFVWRSADGTAWEQEKLKGQRAMALASDGSDLIVAGTAYGKKTEDGVVWAGSVDGGDLEEVARTKNARLSEVLATPSGYQVVGTTGLKQGYGFPSVWTSEDGQTWSEPVRLDDSRGGFPVGAVDGNGVRLVVDNNRRDGLLWRSADGVEWEELSIPREVRGKRDVSFWPVVALDSGFVIGVHGVVKGQKGTQLWYSPDGREWTPAAEASGWLQQIVAGPWGLFISLAPPTGKQGRAKKGVPGKLLWSEGGTEWCRLQLDSLAGISVGGMSSGPEGQLLVVGSAGSSYGGTPTLFEGTPAKDAGIPCTPLSVPSAPGATVTMSAPVVEPPSMVAACDTAGAREAAGASMYCASDLIAKGSKGVKPAQALSSTPNTFKQGGCVKPAGGTTQDRALLCLHDIASSWRGWQRKAEADGLVAQKGYDAVLPMYQWGASALSKADKQYLDQGLSKLDRFPLGWEREAPKKLRKASAVRSAPTRNASVATLRSTLQKAWLQSDLAPIMDSLAETPGGWEQPAVPQGMDGTWGVPVDYLWYYLGDRGGIAPSTGLVSKCALAIDSQAIRDAGGSIRTETCAKTAALAWLLYEATGDDRFFDVTVGLRDMALGAATTEGLGGGGSGKGKLFFQTFDCYLGKGNKSQGCFSGL